MTSARPKPEPQRGDLVEVHWVDIFEDTVGDPDEASLARRISIGFFWDRRKDRGLDVVVTTTTLERDITDGQNGYCIYPAGCVTKLNVIRKAKAAHGRTKAKGTGTGRSQTPKSNAKLHGGESPEPVLREADAASGAGSDREDSDLQERGRAGAEPGETGRG